MRGLTTTSVLVGIVLCLAPVGLATATEPTRSLVTVIDVPGDSAHRSLVDPRTIWVKYSEHLDTASFRVTLDGEDVTAWFMPAFWPQEEVHLPFKDGRNVLVIEARAKNDVQSAQVIRKLVEYGALPPDILAPTRQAITREALERQRRMEARRGENVRAGR